MLHRGGRDDEPSTSPSRASGSAPPGSPRSRRSGSRPGSSGAGRRSAVCAERAAPSGLVQDRVVGAISTSNGVKRAVTAASVIPDVAGEASFAFWITISTSPCASACSSAPPGQGEVVRRPGSAAGLDRGAAQVRAQLFRGLLPDAHAEAIAADADADRVGHGSARLAQLPGAHARGDPHSGHWRRDPALCSTAFSLSSSTGLTRW